MNYIASRTLWFCLALVLASRGGKAFTARAHRHVFGKPVSRGGAATKSATKQDKSINNEINIDDLDEVRARHALQFCTWGKLVDVISEEALFALFVCACE